MGFQTSNQRLKKNKNKPGNKKQAKNAQEMEEQEGASTENRR
jgi:hypothetical protein